MSLIQRIKSVLGLNGSTPRDDEGPVAVTVEHEPPEEETVLESEPTESSESDPSDTESGAEEFTHDGPLTEISGIGPSYSERLGEAGIDTVGELAQADAEELGEATELSPKRIDGWIEAAREFASDN